MRDLTDLVRTATSQDGLLTIAQLRNLRVDRSAQRRLCRNGILVPVFRGVVRLAGAPVTWTQTLRAACLTPGAPLVASHRSALRLWDLRTVDDAVEVSVRVPGDRRLAGVVVHRSVDLCARDVTDKSGIRVTTPARTLVDAGLRFPETEVQRLADHIISTGLATKSQLIEVRRRVGEHGRNGVVSLDLAIDGLPAGSAGAESGPEVALLRLLSQSGLPSPVLQFPVRVGGRRRRIDVAYPEVLVALEYDGSDVHTRVEGFVEDRRRQNELTAIGWTVLRYTHADLRDRPGAVVAQIRPLLDL